MVLINDKKYSCATCIKGHRSTTCTHTDRPLYEIKRKGRPVTQCEHCRTLRATKHLHVKCRCGAKASASTKTGDGLALPSQAGTSAVLDPSRPPFAGTHSDGQQLAPISNVRPKSLADETRKGKPGPTATFPRGLKDVHEDSAAAEVLNALASGVVQPEGGKSRIDSLLNPSTETCACGSAGPCNCCLDPATGAPYAPWTSVSSATSAADRAAAPAVSSKPPQTLYSAGGSKNSSTENLAEMFQAKATTAESCCHNGLVAPIQAKEPTPRPTLTRPPSASSHHHPAHTNPHVHKTKLFSPYGGTNHHRSTLTKKPSNKPPMPLILDPRTHVNLSLTFLAFPTDRPLELSGCMCSEDCACPGCTIHDNKKVAPSNLVDLDHSPDACPMNCDSCFDCRVRIQLSPGVKDADELRQIAVRDIPLQKTPPPDFADLLGPASESGLATPSGYGSDSGANSSDRSSVKRSQSCKSRKPSAASLHHPRPILPRPSTDLRHSAPTVVHKSSNGHEHHLTFPHNPGASTTKLSPPLESELSYEVLRLLNDPNPDPISEQPMSPRQLDAMLQQFLTDQALEPNLNSSGGGGVGVGVDDSGIELANDPARMNSISSISSSSSHTNEDDEDPLPEPLSPQTQAILRSVQATTGWY